VALTKRGWNNVLIFSCMGMILIFNLMGGKLIENAEGDITSVLPEQSMILTLENPDFSIERLGTNWRVTPSERLSTEAAQAIINKWLAMQGGITLLPGSDEQGYRVMVWLAGDELPRRYWVQPKSGLITDIIKQKTWRVSPELLAELE